MTTELHVYLSERMNEDFIQLAVIKVARTPIPNC